GTKPLINTGSLARWKDAMRLGELFQQFVKRSGKPLKRLAAHGTSSHRAKAPVLMRSCRSGCEISGSGSLQRGVPMARRCVAMVLIFAASTAFLQSPLFAASEPLGQRAQPSQQESAKTEPPALAT